MRIALVVTASGSISSRDIFPLPCAIVDLVVPRIKVYRMVAVNIPVDWIASIGSVECGGKVIAKSEPMNSLAHAYVHSVSEEAGCRNVRDLP